MTGLFTKHRMLVLLFAALFAALLFAGLASLGGVFAANAKNEYKFDGIHITRESLTVRVGGSFKLTTRKINTGNDAEVWTSENTAVATVEGGEVFGVKPGKTTIKVTKGDFTDTIPVTVIEEDPAVLEYEHTAELLRDFLDLRFGMFLHFNSSTYEFADIGGDWAGENRASTFDPASWNPSDIDCREWAKAAKSAGMSFAVLTTKHHDGFNIWDSKYTDYDIGNATYKEDIVKLFTDACREEGIKPGLYFSMLDIKHGITSQSCTPNDVEFIKAQIRELMTNYGEIPFIIFDAWNAYWGGPNYTPLPYEEIVNLVHTYQPNCLVINISCEANSVRSQVAMFESAAGQNVPDWFDGVNISCNTPTSHWFWCTKYNSETFKDADWVLNQNVNKFRESDTVFILNVSPNQKGVLIPKYTKLLADIGKGYQKMADVEKLPDRYISDYDYHENLLFHKVTTASSSDGNAVADRVVDGYTDYSFSHETANKTQNGASFWMGDIGYREKIGKLFVHVSSDMPKASLDKTYAFLLKEDPGRSATYAKLDKGEYVAKKKLTDGSVTENCYTLDFEGAEGRYLVIAVEGTGQISLSEVVLNAAGSAQDAAYSLRDKFALQSYTVGGQLNLPADALFVTKKGGLVRETITWETKNLDLTKTGTVTVKGTSKSGCEVSLTLRIVSAGLYAEVPSVGVKASSMWSQAEDLGWAHSRNLIDKSGLTINSANILYSTHDNPWNGTTLWHTREGQTTGWLIFDLGKVSRVTNALIWNHNQENETDRGVKKMTVYYTDKAEPGEGDWIRVDEYTLTKASALPAQAATDFISFGAIEARKIKFELTENYGDPSVVGMSEIIFFADKNESKFDLSALNTAIGSFEMLSRFDYSEAAYAAARTAYQAALTGIKSASSQGDIDRLAASLTEKLDALKQGYSPKNPTGLTSYTVRIEAGKGLPDKLTVRFSDGSSREAAVRWDALPADKLTQPGSFGLNGLLEGTPYTVSASVVVTGTSDASLKQLVKDYGEIDTKGYTEESVKTFTDALAAAKTLLADASRTQEKVDGAKAALTSARYALTRVFAPVTPDNPENPENPEDPKDPETPDSTEKPGEPETPNTTEAPDTTGKTPDTDTPGSEANFSGPKEKDGNLGLILGIVGGVLVLAAAAAVTVFLVRKRKS